jgi:hypothetical protein
MKRLRALFAVAGTRSRTTLIGACCTVCVCAAVPASGQAQAPPVTDQLPPFAASPPGPPPEAAPPKSEIAPPTSPSPDLNPPRVTARVRLASRTVRLRGHSMVLKVQCNASGRVTVTTRNGTRIGRSSFDCSRSVVSVRLRVSSTGYRKVIRRRSVPMIARFHMGNTIFRRRFTLKTRSVATRSSVGGATGAPVTCRNAGELGAVLPTLSAGSPTISRSPDGLSDQWTDHITVLYRTNAAGQWVESMRTAWILGFSYNGSPVSSWGDKGWWISTPTGWWNGNSVDWELKPGKGWWRVVHYIYWWDNGWGEGAWANALHYDYTAPGGGGGGPTNNGTAYNWCFIE